MFSGAAFSCILRISDSETLAKREFTPTILFLLGSSTIRSVGGEQCSMLRLPLQCSSWCRRITYKDFDFYKIAGLVKTLHFSFFAGAIQRQYQGRSITNCFETGSDAGKLWMSLRAVLAARACINKLISRKILITVAALCIFAYLYWTHHHYNVHIASRKPHARIVNNETRENARYADFLETWCRLKRMRVDWKQVLRPCADNMEWGKNKGFQHSQSRTDAAKSYLISWDIRPAGQFSRFEIQSVTRDNLDKTVGGDSWRIHIRGPSSMSPTVVDHGNGKYEVIFLVLEPGKYHIEVVLEYSLCDGYRDPPRDWFIKGQ